MYSSLSLKSSKFNSKEICGNFTYKKSPKIEIVKIPKWLKFYDIFVCCHMSITFPAKVLIISPETIHSSNLRKQNQKLKIIRLCFLTSLSTLAWTSSLSIQRVFYIWFVNVLTPCRKQNYYCFSSWASFLKNSTVNNMLELFFRVCFSERNGVATIFSDIFYCHLDIYNRQTSPQLSKWNWIVTVILDDS